MAYYDFNGTITIDEVAAKRDIQKINLVIPRLEAAKATLDRLREEGENTKGECGSAISEKALELSRKIAKLIQNLRETRDIIEKTIRH